MPWVDVSFWMSCKSFWNWNLAYISHLKQKGKLKCSLSSRRISRVFGVRAAQFLLYFNSCFWLVVCRGKFKTIQQSKNLCACSSSFRGKKLQWHLEMSAFRLNTLQKFMHLIRLVWSSAFKSPSVCPQSFSRLSRSNFECWLRCRRRLIHMKLICTEFDSVYVKYGFWTRRKGISMFYGNRSDFL